MQTKWSNFGKGEMSDVFIQGRSNFLNAKKNYLKGILENKMIWMACSEKAKFALKKKKVIRDIRMSKRPILSH